MRRYFTFRNPEANRILPQQVEFDKKAFVAMPHKFELESWVGISETVAALSYNVITQGIVPVSDVVTGLQGFACVQNGTMTQSTFLANSSLANYVFNGIFTGNQTSLPLLKFLVTPPAPEFGD